ncbi:unnamed protein product [Nezara viridula]|uniref:Uncharacterized protein n=1 Tax=Nezara viridula TaxID=85310 RepID=A0A9P0MMY4_NEZVI|nr:unnamed protein product [Nezara viridula]
MIKCKDKMFRLNYNLSVVLLINSFILLTLVRNYSVPWRGQDWSPPQFPSQRWLNRCTILYLKTYLVQTLYFLNVRHIIQT